MGTEEKELTDEWLRWAMKRSSLSYSWKLLACVIGRMLCLLGKWGMLEEGEGMGKRSR